MADRVLRKFYLEEQFRLDFSLKQRLYYTFLRPILSRNLRRKLQGRVNAKRSYRENFINAEFVDAIQMAHTDARSLDLFPSANTSAIVLTHDVEDEEGFRFIPRVLELERRYNFKSSWNIVPYKYGIDKGILNAIHQAGGEIGIHGYNHDGKLYFSRKIFHERVPHINRALKEYGAVGFRSPMVHRNLRWLQQLDIQYDASCFDYDPFQPFPGGTGSIWPFIAGKFVELPYTIPQDHTLFYVLRQNDITIWKKKVDWVCQNHGMVLALTHPDYLLQGSHLRLYEGLLDFLSGIHRSWRCLPKEMAQWWTGKFDPQVSRSTRHASTSNTSDTPLDPRKVEST
jgi:peptidoglycan/xylan/chitin deacetylase (PgdA/CDA1 family)